MEQVLYIHSKLKSLKGGKKGKNQTLISLYSPRRKHIYTYFIHCKNILIGNLCTVQLKVHICVIILLFADKVKLYTNILLTTCLKLLTPSNRVMILWPETTIVQNVCTSYVGITILENFEYSIQFILHNFSKYQLNKWFAGYLYAFHNS